MTERPPRDSEPEEAEAELAWLADCIAIETRIRTAFRLLGNDAAWNQPAANEPCERFRMLEAERALLSRQLSEVANDVWLESLDGADQADVSSAAADSAAADARMRWCGRKRPASSS